METKKPYFTPETWEKWFNLESSFVATGSSGSLEEGNVLDYDDDFWS